MNAPDRVGRLHEDPIADGRAIVARELVHQATPERRSQRALERGDVVFAAALADDASRDERRSVGSFAEQEQELLAEKRRETERFELGRKRQNGHEEPRKWLKEGTKRAVSLRS